MVSFVDFYLHFLANFQTKTSPHMFSIFSLVAHSVSLGYLWPLLKKLLIVKSPICSRKQLFANCSSLILNKDSRYIHCIFHTEVFSATLSLYTLSIPYGSILGNIRSHEMSAFF